MRSVGSRALLLLLCAGSLTGCGASTVSFAGAGESSAPPRAGSRAEGPPPDRMTVQGVDLRLDQAVPFATAQIAQEDPATLIVIGGQDAHTKPNPCTLYTVGRLLSQSEDSVRVGLYVYRTVDGLAAGEGCSAIGYPPARIAITLDQPLGDRTLICDKDDSPVAVSDPRALLHPGELPPGYERPGQLEMEQRAAGAIVNVTTYKGPTPEVALHIFEGPPGAVEPSGNQQTLERMRVRGHDAVLQQTAGFPDVKCLRWRETADLALAVCTRGNPEGPLTAAQLARVAESLTRDS